MQKRGFFEVVRRDDFLFRLTVLFYSSILAPAILLFLGLSKYYSSEVFIPPLALFPDWFCWVVSVVCFATILCGVFLYHIRIKNARTQVTLRWKAQKFLKAASYKYALPAFGATFSALCFYLTGEYVFAVVVISTLILFSLERPSLKKTSKELSLQGNELTLFRSDDAWQA